MAEELPEEPQLYTRKWYFSKEEIEDFSPSRKDGISLKKESELRKLYCSFLQELGMKLKVPQVTIACAMMLCHRFYMRQSHAKNDWQTIATVSMFLSSKIEETRNISLGDVVIRSYEMMYKGDTSAPQRIRQKREDYNKQKELIVTGERLLLATIAYDFDIQLPYKPLVAALKRLKIVDLTKVAWNFVNDWLCTTLCLQYKPHYIAAGSMFLAAKLQKVKLPAEKGKFWWLEFDISPKQLEEVIKQMLKLLEQDRKQALPPRQEKVIQSTTALSGKMNVSSPHSSITDGSIARRHSSQGAITEVDRPSKSLPCGEKKICAKEVLPCQTSDSASSSVVEDDRLSKSMPCGEKQICAKEVLPCQTSDSASSSVVEDDRLSKPLLCGEKQICAKEVLPCQTSDSASSSVVEDVQDESRQRTVGTDQNSSYTINSVQNTYTTKIDTNRIKEALKKRKTCDGAAAVEDVEDESRQKTVGTDQNSSYKIISVQNTYTAKIDTNRIKEALKKRKTCDGAEALKKRKTCDGAANDFVEGINPEMDCEAWIERELENGIELESTPSKKEQAKYCEVFTY